MRTAKFSESPQLSLGELIKKLEVIEDKSINVLFDFEYAVPTTIDSWRGAYDEVAIGFSMDKGWREWPTVESLLAELKSAVGKTFTGYKGGDYTMSEETPV